MEQVVILLVLAAVAFLNWLAKKAQGQGSGDVLDGGPTPGTQGPSSPPRRKETDEERMRRFMEALGVPTAPPPRPRAVPPASSPPHPPSTPPPVPPAVREATRHMPPPMARRIERKAEEAARRAQELKRLAEAAGRRAVAERIESDFPHLESVARESAPSPAPSATRGVAGPAAAGNLRPLLASPSELRRAIVLREILGPPRALEELGDAPGLR